jgi:hypothetical protein
MKAVGVRLSLRDGWRLDTHGAIVTTTIFNRFTRRKRPNFEGGRPESVARFTVSLSPKVTMFFGTKLILGNAHWASAQASADFAAADIAVLDIALEPIARRVGVTIRSRLVADDGSERIPAPDRGRRAPTNARIVIPAVICCPLVFRLVTSRSNFAASPPTHGAREGWQC